MGGQRSDVTFPFGDSATTGNGVAGNQGVGGWAAAEAYGATMLHAVTAVYTGRFTRNAAAFGKGLLVGALPEMLPPDMETAFKQLGGTAYVTSGMFLLHNWNEFSRGGGEGSVAELERTKAMVETIITPAEWPRVVIEFSRMADVMFGDSSTAYEAGLIIGRGFAARFVAVLRGPTREIAYDVGYIVGLLLTDAVLIMVAGAGLARLASRLGAATMELVRPLVALARGKVRFVDVEPAISARGLVPARTPGPAPVVPVVVPPAAPNVPAASVPAASVPAASVPAASVPAASVPAASAPAPLAPITAVERGLTSGGAATATSADEGMNVARGLADPPSPPRPPQAPRSPIPSTVPPLDSRPFIEPGRPGLRKPKVFFGDRDALKRYFEMTSLGVDPRDAALVWKASWKATTYRNPSPVLGATAARNGYQRFLVHLYQHGPAPTPALRQLTKEGWNTVRGYLKRLYIQERGLKAWQAFDHIHHDLPKGKFPAVAFDAENLYPVLKDLHELIHDILSGGAGRSDRMTQRFGGPDLDPPSNYPARSNVTVGPNPEDVLYDPR